MKSGEIPSSDDVLEMFGVEPEHDGSTLQRYLRDYPQYAEELIDFSRELSREAVERSDPPSAEEEAFLNTAWTTFLAASPAAPEDPLAALSVPDLRDLSIKLGVPRQVIAAFRERRVAVASVPRRFLALFAAELNIATDVFTQLLSGPVLLQEARKFKAMSKPTAGTPATFRQLLVDAGVPMVEIEELMTEDK